MRAVDQERMMERGKKVKYDVDALDKMAAMLRHALEDAEDIFDNSQEKIAVRCWHRLYVTLAACIALCKCSCIWIARIVRTKSAWLVQWARDISMSFLLRRTSQKPAPMNISAAASNEPPPVRIDIPASDSEPDPVTTGVVAYETVPVTTGAAASGELDPVTTGAKASGDENVPVTTGAKASGGENVPVTTGAAASDDETVPVTTSVVASDKLDPVTTSVVASDDETISVTTTTSVVASGQPDPVTTSAAISDNETVSVTTGAVASREPDPVTTGDEASGNEIVQVTMSAEASDDESDPMTTSVETSYDEPDPMTTASHSSGRWLYCLCTLFDFFKNCCASLYSWLVHLFEATCFYRDWSYEVVGIKKCQENATLLDIFLTAISRGILKKRVHKVENTVSEVKKSPLLGMASNNAPNDIANKNRRILGAASKREVFGRELLRDEIMAKLRETTLGDAASLSTSSCYSAIGIYGAAGSGKTTFAGYIRDYIKEECKEEKLFDTIMCIHVSETFSVEDIFQEMLKDITKDSHSNISDHGGLNKKLKEALRGKRFFLILDDLWVKNKNDQQLEELISPLNVGLKGSKILVTARTKDAPGALCADELIEMPDLDEDQYLKMFMHYALGGTSIADKEFERVGILIAKKLHRSPIVAVTVAGRLGTNRDMDFWKNTANHETFNETFDALWWSYQQLNPDIRRCLEYCNIFPRRSKLNKHDLVRLWIAQGFVKTSYATEDMEDVAEGYIQELVSCSFLQPKGTDLFIIHDLLHDLIHKIVGSDCFRIENERSQRGGGWKGDVPRDVRHLFVQNYDVELITEMILGLENLRTLIIDVVEGDTPVEEKVIDSICKRLPKLRVLAVAFSKKHGGIRKPNKFSVPKSIAQLKHLRYLAFRTDYSCSVTLPSGLTKLHHIQLLDFYHGQMLEFPFADLVNLRHMFCWSIIKFSNLGRLISIQTLPCFIVSNEQGYEVKQLRDLNKLRGSLEIGGLENVKSKEETLEANLAAKERFTELRLQWVDDTRCSPEVEAEVLEGLCPPVGLQKLDILGYKGSRYPDWMVGKQSGGPEGLRILYLVRCSQLGRGPQFEAFPHLRELLIYYCSCDSLPGNMEHLTLLKRLDIMYCKNIRSLPTLPQSIEEFYLAFCNDEFMKSCKTVGHPNWEKIEHIPRKNVRNPAKRQ